MNERERLFETVEGVRAVQFPDLDPNLVQDILTIQLQQQEDSAEANRRTEKVISQWADTHAEDQNQ